MITCTPFVLRQILRKDAKFSCNESVHSTCVLFHPRRDRKSNAMDSKITKIMTGDQGPDDAVSTNSNADEIKKILPMRKLIVRGKATAVNKNEQCEEATKKPIIKLNKDEIKDEDNVPKIKRLKSDNVNPSSSINSNTIKNRNDVSVVTKATVNTTEDMKKLDELVFSKRPEAKAGRAWLIFMITLKSIISSYVVRHKLKTLDEVDDSELYELLEYWIQMHLLQNANTDKEKLDIENTIRIVCESRHKLAHHDNVILFHDYQEWITNWIKLADFLLSDNRYKKSEDVEKTDSKLLNQLKIACSALQEKNPNTDEAKAAFSFAFENTPEAKAAMAFLVIGTVVVSALKECVAKHRCAKFEPEQSEHEPSAVKILIYTLYDSRSFMKGKVKNQVCNLFFAKQNICGFSGIIDTRNVLAHNKKCRQRNNKTYDDFINSWDQLLSKNVLNSSDAFKRNLEIAKSLLLAPINTKLAKKITLS
jgi:hypothetical protein